MFFFKFIVFIFILVRNAIYFFFRFWYITVPLILLIYLVYKAKKISINKKLNKDNENVIEINDYKVE